LLNVIILPEKFKFLFKIFKGELGLLEKMFTDLARKTQGKAIDKATFLQLFNLPGMVGERLFAVFDV
jgi:hypothetical protein